jgi:hypothetical protein
VTDRDDALRRNSAGRAPKRPTGAAGCAEPPLPNPGALLRPSIFRRIEPGPPAEKDDERAARWSARARRLRARTRPAGGQPDAPPPPDPERPGGSFRGPRYGPPPIAPRYGPIPTVNRHDGTWVSKPLAAAARPAGPGAPPPPQTVGAGQPCRPRGPRRHGAPPPPRPIPDSPTTWCPHARCRPAAAGVSLYKATFGLVNLGPSPDESIRPSWSPESSRCCAGTTRSA